MRHWVAWGKSVPFLSGCALSSRKCSRTATGTIGEIRGHPGPSLRKHRSRHQDDRWLMKAWGTCSRPDDAVLILLHLVEFFHGVVAAAEDGELAAPDFGLVVEARHREQRE